MNKSKISGWKDVFSFTLIQTMKSKSFMSTTIVFSLIFLVSIIGVNVYSGITKKNDVQKQQMEMEDGNGVEDTTVDGEKKVFANTMYYKDETGLQLSKDEIQAYLNQRYENISLQVVNDEHSAFVETMKTEDANSSYLHLCIEEGKIQVELYLPKGSTYSEEEADVVCMNIADYIASWKEQVLSLDENQAKFLNANIQTLVTTNENKSAMDKLVEQYLPMCFCLVLYMCIVLYGSMVGNSVATEKSSKVMELLLTSIRPLAIIVGKVLSMMVLAISQLLFWIVLGLVGNGIGTIVAKKIYPSYSNVIAEFLTEFDLLSMFSPIRILSALLVFVLGFLFYCMLAGLMGATVSKGEDLNSAMSVYSTISAIGFLLAYFPSMIGSKGIAIQNFSAIFPLSSPFLLPGNILIGNTSLVVVVIGIVLLFAIVIGFAFLVAQVYEMVILYNGNKIGLKQIREMMKHARNE